MALRHNPKDETLVAYEYKLSSECRLAFRNMTTITSEMLRAFPRAIYRGCNKCDRQFVSLDFQYRRCMRCDNVVKYLGILDSDLGQLVDEKASRSSGNSGRREE